MFLLTGSVFLLWMLDSKHKQAKLSRPLHGPGSWSEEEWMSAWLIKLHTHFHMAFFSWSDVQFFCFGICLRCCFFPLVSKSYSPLLQWLGHTALVHTKGDHFSSLVWCQTTLHSFCSFSQWPWIRGLFFWITFLWILKQKLCRKCMWSSTWPLLVMKVNYL